MADDADITEERLEVSLGASIATIRARADDIPKGEPGECNKCGEDSPRLVNGVCARCRDRYKLP